MWLQRCQAQISSTASSVQADTHFRAVCRALVAETLEFSDFLVKVTQGQSIKAPPPPSYDVITHYLGPYLLGVDEVAPTPSIQLH